MKKSNNVHVIVLLAMMTNMQGMEPETKRKKSPTNQQSIAISSNKRKTVPMESNKTDEDTCLIKTMKGGRIEIEPWKVKEMKVLSWILLQQRGKNCIDLFTIREEACNQKPMVKIPLIGVRDFNYGSFTRR